MPDSDALTWEQRLAKRYWERLFKEYVVADLSRYREGDIGLRWRTEQEVIDGRGQFSCGNKACNRRDVPLTSYELHFGYLEHGQAREALVKVRCCKACAEKLNYRKDRDRDRAERKRARKEARREKNRRKRHVRERRTGSAESSDDDRDGDEIRGPVGAGEEASPGLPAGGNRAASLVGMHASSGGTNQPSERSAALSGRREEEEDYLLDELLP
jgi:protein FRA10AC1